MNKAFLDITPIVITYNGETFNLGMVRYEVNTEMLRIDRPDLLQPQTFYSSPVPIDNHAWSKLQFKVEIKSGDVAQPTKIEPEEIDVISAATEVALNLIRTNDPEGFEKILRGEQLAASNFINRVRAHQEKINRGETE